MQIFDIPPRLFQFLNLHESMRMARTSTTLVNLNHQALDVMYIVASLRRMLQNTEIIVHLRAVHLP